jgi:hypothetical protein
MPSGYSIREAEHVDDTMVVLLGAANIAPWRSTCDGFGLANRVRVIAA